jgi:hypothetical protein
MTAISIGRVAVPSLALVAACVTTLVFGIQVWREQPVETRAATAAPAVAPPAFHLQRSLAGETGTVVVS